MEAHDLNTKISQAINVAFEEKASDPISRVVELLSAKRQESLKEQGARIAELERQNRKLERQNQKLQGELAESEEQLRASQAETQAQMLRANSLQARIAKLEAENNVMYIDTMELSRYAPLYPFVTAASIVAYDHTNPRLLALMALAVGWEMC